MRTSEDVRKWVAEIIHEKHPDYEVQLLNTSKYAKISLMYQYGDLCIMRLGESWFSLHRYRGIDKNDPLFDNVENKNRNHWEIPIRSRNEILKYKDHIIPIVEDLAQTYEIEKYPYGAENSSKYVDLAEGGVRIHIGNK